MAPVGGVSALSVGRARSLGVVAGGLRQAFEARRQAGEPRRPGVGDGEGRLQGVGGVLSRARRARIGHLSSIKRKTSDNATLSDIASSRQARRFCGQELAKSAGME